MTVQIIEIAGQKMALLPEEEYRQLMEVAEDNADRASAIVAAHRARDGEEYIPASVLEQLLSGEPPLRVWRKYRGLSQQELAERLGCSKMKISSIELGKQETSIRDWRALANALSVDLEDILPGE